MAARNGAGPSVACSNSGSCVESGDSCGSLMRIHRQQGLARADTSGPHHWVDPVAVSPSLVSYGEGYSTSPADAPWLHGVKAAMTTVLGWASRRRFDFPVFLIFSWFGILLILGFSSGLTSGCSWFCSQLIFLFLVEASAWFEPMHASSYFLSFLIPPTSISCSLDLSCVFHYPQ